MKQIDLDRILSRLVPPGIDFHHRERWILLGGLILEAVWSLHILDAYFNARDLLYTGYGPLRRLDPQAVMTPFAALLPVGLAGFGVFVLGMLLLGLAHHAYHRRDSMSLYLMKRLPDRREYWVRCWAVPVLAILAGAVLMAALIGVYYVIYRTCTPAPCLR